MIMKTTEPRRANDEFRYQPGGAWGEQSTGHGDQFGQGGEGRYKGREIKHQISKIGGASLDGRMMRSALVMLRQLLVERSIDLEIWSSGRNS